MGRGRALGTGEQAHAPAPAPAARRVRDGGDARDLGGARRAFLPRPQLGQRPCAVPAGAAHRHRRVARCLPGARDLAPRRGGDPPRAPRTAAHRLRTARGRLAVAGRVRRAAARGVGAHARGVAGAERHHRALHRGAPRAWLDHAAQGHAAPRGAGAPRRPHRRQRDPGSHDDRGERASRARACARSPPTAVRERSLLVVPQGEASVYPLLTARAFDRLYDELYGLVYAGDPRVPLRDSESP